MNSLRYLRRLLAGCVLAGAMAGLPDAPAHTAWGPTAAAAAEDVPHQAILLPWGTDDAALGRISGPELEPGGPLAFAAEPDGAVLLLDSVHHAVKRVRFANTAAAKTSSAATAAATTQVLARGVAATAIASDGAGGFVVREGATISRYAPAPQAGTSTAAKSAGAAAHQRDAAVSAAASLGSDEGYGMELWCESGAAWVQRLDQKTLPTLALSAPARAGAAISAQPLPGRRITLPAPAARLAQGGAADAAPAEAPPPLTFVLRRLDGTDLRLLGIVDDEKALVNIPVRVDSGAIGAALFKGADAQGNLYVELERIGGAGTPPRTVALEVHRYAPGGARLAVFALPNSYKTTVHKKTELLPDGSILQMLTGESGVELRRYVK